MDNNIHDKINQKVYSNSGNKAVISLIEGEHLNILDIGCGAGDNARMLTKWGHQVDGITLSDEEADACREFMRKVYVYNIESGLPQELNGQYDIIICSHVLEHIVYPDLVLRDIKNHLQEEGKIIVALPNLMHYKSRMQLIFGNFNYRDSGIWDYTHVKWYTFVTGRKLLEENGFTVKNCFVDGDIPFLTIFGKVPEKLRNFIFMILTFISKGLFGGQMIYIAMLSQNSKAIK